MIKKFFLLLTASVFLFSCATNKTKSENENQKKVVTVSIVPQKTFVQKIAGNDFDINILVPPGSTPEAGNLLPSQLKDIVNSDIWFRIGYIGFEYSWQEKIIQANPEMKVVDLSEDLDLIAETDEHGGKVHESGIDPHIWLSPALVKQMAKKIADELTILNPEKGSEYNLNYLKFVKEIDQLDIDIKNTLNAYKGRKFITFHPSLSYFARDYGLVQYTLESGGKEPTPQHMAEVVKTAQSENINVIYIQSDFDQEHARVFAEEIKGEVIMVTPLSPDWEENLRQMTQIFADNF